MKHFNIYISILILVILAACEDYYEPEIEKFPAALVVEGIITDNVDYVTVKLTRSASYNDPSYYYGERKATVTIESVSGEVFPTIEIDRGVYQTPSKVETRPGEGYFVKIITAAKLEYRSRIEQMPIATPIKEIYLTDSTLKDVTYNYWGEPVVKDYAGIVVSIKPEDPNNDQLGFLYKWNALVNYTVFSKFLGNEFNYFCWKKLSSRQIYVYDFVNDRYLNELPMGDIHTLSFYALGPSLPLDSSRFEPDIQSAYGTSFYYQMQQFTISKEGAKFWRSVKKQSEASGKLFDPVEEQIEGNIYCVNDTSKVAFGYFNAASYSQKILSVKIVRDQHGAVGVMEEMPNPYELEDCFLGWKPDFWF